MIRLLESTHDSRCGVCTPLSLATIPLILVFFSPLGSRGSVCVRNVFPRRHRSFSLSVKRNSPFLESHSSPLLVVGPGLFLPSTRPADRFGIFSLRVAEDRLLRFPGIQFRLSDYLLLLRRRWRVNCIFFSRRDGFCSRGLPFSVDLGSSFFSSMRKEASFQLLFLFVRVVFFPLLLQPVPFTCSLFFFYPGVLWHLRLGTDVPPPPLSDERVFLDIP